MYSLDGAVYSIVHSPGPISLEGSEKMILIICLTDWYDTVFRMESLRILAAMTAQYGLWIHHMDASNTFVGSDLDIPNYISMPEGVDEFETDTEDDIVLELLKSLYGLKQSANLWHGKIKTKLHQMGFNSSSADSSLFTNSNGIIIALYVDDMLVLVYQ